VDRPFPGRNQGPRGPVLACLALLAAAAGPVFGRSGFEALPIAEGVYLMRPPDVAGPRTNSLLVVREDGLLVVDAQPSPEAARELLSAIERVSTKPIRYLVLTHPHVDAAGGATAFPSSTLVIASQGFRDALADPAYDFGAEARLRAGADWKEPPRPRPRLVVPGAVSLEDAVHPVSVYVTPRSHSSGDLIVHLVKDGIVAIGDLVSGLRNPYAGDGAVTAWMATLNDIAAMNPKVVVPLRGPPIGPHEVRLQRDALLWMKGQVHQGFIDGVPPGKIPERVLGSPQLGDYFDREAKPSFLETVAAQLVQETLEYRRKRGIE
jgi:glyoxylase-like metal-dependent hydrolase (beta-lactamase superfamily II)